MTGADLSAIRSRVDGCELIGLADISTMTVLGADSAVWWAQELLDGLCATAAHHLQDEARIAIEARATGCRIFLRGEAASEEVVFAVCAPGTDMDAFLAAVGTLLCTDRPAAATGT